MNYWQKLRLFFQGKKEDENHRETSDKTNLTTKSADKPSSDEIQDILQISQCILHPNELLEAICVAIAFTSGEPVHASARDIRLFMLRNKDDGAIIGSCYAFLYKGRYYGNIVGTKSVFSFSPEKFDMKATEELWVPLRSTDDSVYILVCRLQHSNGKLSVRFLQKLSLPDLGHKVVLHNFEIDVPISQALEECEELLKTV